MPCKSSHAVEGRHTAGVRQGAPGSSHAMPYKAGPGTLFHLTRAANDIVDATRRREQNRTLGQKGRKGDPLHAARGLLTKGAEKLDDKALTQQKSGRLFNDGDPCGEVQSDAGHAKEALGMLRKLWAC